METFWIYAKEYYDESNSYCETYDRVLKGKKTNKVFIDLEKAYYKVPRKVIWRAMIKKEYFQEIH